MESRGDEERGKGRRVGARSSGSRREFLLGGGRLVVERRGGTIELLLFVTPDLPEKGKEGRVRGREGEEKMVDRGRRAISVPVRATTCFIFMLSVRGLSSSLTVIFESIRAQIRWKTRPNSFQSTWVGEELDTSFASHFASSQRTPVSRANIPFT